MCIYIYIICHRGVNFAPARFPWLCTKGPFEVTNLGKSQGIEVSQGIGDANHLLGGIKPRHGSEIGGAGSKGAHVPTAKLVSNAA